MQRNKISPGAHGSIDSFLVYGQLQSWTEVNWKRTLKTNSKLAEKMFYSGTKTKLLRKN